MGHRSDILNANGYTATYETQTKYRGSYGQISLCIARKNNINGIEHLAFKDPGHYSRIRKIQHSIPHMAKFTDQIADIILMEKAQGTLLWELEEIPDPDSIARQLIEFAHGTHVNGLMHGDLRPWNVFVDLNDHCKIKVIDWDSSRFVDDYQHGASLPPHVTSNHGPKPADITIIDSADAKNIAYLMKGTVTFHDAWKQDIPFWHPPWCKR